MRLLSLDELTSTWKIHDFPGPRIPFYAILSHTWGAARDEVNFEDIADGQQKYNQGEKPGYDKIRFCHEKAKEHGLRYFWIDTCCIKKTDSSELQRSLSSMFYWYQRAARCYVYLDDVDVASNPGGVPDDAKWWWDEKFCRSRWFTRGWTLQELIAPASVFFYSKCGSFIEDKLKLAPLLSKVTMIPEPALRGLDLSRYSVKERLDWAEHRRTSVPEDVAYCLLGIFEVDMPILYADGDPAKRKRAAMAHLQKAISERSHPAEEQVDEVFRIGGAYWTDLSTLSDDQLTEFDKDLQSYVDWVLSLHPREALENILSFSQTSGKRMHDLLAKYGVGYEDESMIRTKWVDWKEPWNHYSDRTASSQARVRALADNRMFWMLTHEDGFTLATALRTVEALMIWRGKWKSLA